MPGTTVLSFHDAMIEIHHHAGYDTDRGKFRGGQILVDRRIADAQQFFRHVAILGEIY